MILLDEDMQRVANITVHKDVLQAVLAAKQELAQKRRSNENPMFNVMRLNDNSQIRTVQWNKVNC